MDKPDNANSGCVGTQSEQAGKAAGCAGCPNQKACASGATKAPDPALKHVKERMDNIKHKILVLSGKGGVGKSTFSSQLAFALAGKGFKVGLLDIDICGPSIPLMLGLQGQEVHQSGSGWSPVYVPLDQDQDAADEAGMELGVMSIGFMLSDHDDAVIWRGPRKNGLIKQFLTDVDWGELDYLVVDTPPGTSDEHISIVQYLKGSMSEANDGAVVVTTPQEASMADVRKELNFCKKTNLRILGVVENMSGMQFALDGGLVGGAGGGGGQGVKFVNKRSGKDETAAALAAIKSRCPELLDMFLDVQVFPAGKDGGPEEMANKFGVPFLGKVPLDPNMVACCEDGRSFSSDATNKASPAYVPINSVVDRVIASVP